MSLTWAKFIAITGGPCGGKSTFMGMARNLLEKHNFKVITVPEVARELIKAGIVPWDLSWQDPDSFQEQVFLGIIEKESRFLQAVLRQNLGENQEVVFLCDRGLVDGMAYSGEEQYRGMLQRMGLSFSSVIDHYTSVIHLVTAADGAEHYYTTDKERVETPEQARERDKATLQVWLKHQHLSIIDNSTDFPEKINRAILALGRTLNMPMPKEIEKKYEVLDFDPSKIPANAQSYDITQIYLRLRHDRPGMSCRVRAKTTDGQTSYYYTEKTPMETEGVRGESEEQISFERYHELIATYEDRRLQMITKTRYKFPYGSFVFELDVYHEEFAGLVTLEVEVQREEDLERATPPPCFKVIDRTGDKRFLNETLAEKGKP